MIGGGATTGARGRGRRRVPVASGLLVVAGLALWGGCDAQKHYRVLSFFFDGVPDPNARLGMAADASASPTFSSHVPFANDDCFECHADPSQMQLTIDDSGACLKCHEEVLTGFPRMHGAVVAPACLRCHNPHFSALAHLIREPAPAMCLRCHDTNFMGSPTPPHEDLTRDCLECHRGHGGDDSHFLRSTWTPPPRGASPAGSGPGDAS